MARDKDNRLSNMFARMRISPEDRFDREPEERHSRHSHRRRHGNPVRITFSAGEDATDPRRNNGGRTIIYNTGEWCDEGEDSAPYTPRSSTTLHVQDGSSSRRDSSDGLDGPDIFGLTGQEMRALRKATMEKINQHILREFDREKLAKLEEEPRATHSRRRERHGRREGHERREERGRRDEREGQRESGARGEGERREDGRPRYMYEAQRRTGVDNYRRANNRPESPDQNRARRNGVYGVPPSERRGTSSAAHGRSQSSTWDTHPFEEKFNNRHSGRISSRSKGRPNQATNENPVVEQSDSDSDSDYEPEPVWYDATCKRRFEDGN